MAPECPPSLANPAIAGRSFAPLRNRGVIIRDMSAELAMLIAEKQNLSGDVSALQRAREHGTLVQCLCIYRRLFVRFLPLVAFSNHHERARRSLVPSSYLFPVFFESLSAEGDDFI